MPAGNHHYTPHGHWWETPKSSTVPRLIFKTARNLALTALFFYGLNAYRAMLWNYTYTSFIGKTMTLGNVSTATHEPASVEYIDKLKAEEAERKKRRASS
jgi:hypothetical protein